jgi:hypothetical protein
MRSFTLGLFVNQGSKSIGGHLMRKIYIQKQVVRDRDEVVVWTCANKVFFVHFPKYTVMNRCVKKVYNRTLQPSQLSQSIKNHHCVFTKYKLI